MYICSGFYYDSIAHNMTAFAMVSSGGRLTDTEAMDSDNGDMLKQTLDTAIELDLKSFQR